MDPFQDEFYQFDNSFDNRQAILPFWFWWLIPGPWQPGPGPRPPGPPGPWQPGPGPRPPRW